MDVFFLLAGYFQSVIACVLQSLLKIEYIYNVYNPASFRVCTADCTKTVHSQVNNVIKTLGCFF